MYLLNFVKILPPTPHPREMLLPWIRRPASPRPSSAFGVRGPKERGAITQAWAQGTVPPAEAAAMTKWDFSGSNSEMHCFLPPLGLLQALKIPSVRSKFIKMNVKKIPLTVPGLFHSWLERDVLKIPIRPEYSA